MIKPSLSLKRQGNRFDLSVQTDFSQDDQQKPELVN